jgi:hypothetical protein
LGEGEGELTFLRGGDNFRLIDRQRPVTIG